MCAYSVLPIINKFEKELKNLSILHQSANTTFSPPLLNYDTKTKYNKHTNNALKIIIIIIINTASSV